MIKCDDWRLKRTHGWTDLHMTKCKIIWPPPLCGRGIKMTLNGHFFYINYTFGFIFCVVSKSKFIDYIEKMTLNGHFSI